MIRVGGVSQIPLPGPAAKAAEQSVAGTVTEFGQFLQEALTKVELAQNDAAVAAQKLATGEIQDVAEVMIASEKATLALQLTIQVRNKVLEAYQEIMRMPV